MRKNHRGGSRQAELFPQSKRMTISLEADDASVQVAPAKRPTIQVEPNHLLVQLTDRLDWTELEMRAEVIRGAKLKNRAGRPPHLRQLLGALVLMATRRLSYRDAEDQIRYYAPARYLCALTETEWTPDHTTIQDFHELMGEEGVRMMNEYTVGLAVEEKFADPKVVVADTTAQEAKIPWPNEMGLMASFFTAVTAACKRGGRALRAFATSVADKMKAAKEKVRRYRLFTKTKQARIELLEQMAKLIDGTQAQLAEALAAADASREKLAGHGKVAQAKAAQLHETMKKLLPQIRYWLRTGWVAKDKIINLHIPQLYSIVRGKVGKPVEFGLQWGIARLRGGYLLATVAENRRDLVDAKFAVQAVRDQIALYGKAPRAFAYDRAGHSAKNVATLKELGVKQVGLAPRGKTEWSVSGKVKDDLVRERAQVEGGIGTIKSAKYGFNRPEARSAAMMGTLGQRAVLGCNLTKLIRDIARRNEVALAG